MKQAQHVWIIVKAGSGDAWEFVIVICLLLCMHEIFHN